MPEVEFGQITQVALIILIVAIALGVGGIVLGNIGTTQLKSVSVTDQNLAAANATVTSLVNKDLSSIDTVYEKNTSIKINTTATQAIYYVPNLEQGQVTIYINDISKLNTTAINVTYTANQRSYAYNTTAEGAQGGDQLSSWIPTIALIFIAGIILTLIMTAIVYQRRDSL